MSTRQPETAFLILMLDVDPLGILTPTPSHIGIYSSRDVTCSLNRCWYTTIATGRGEDFEEGIRDLGRQAKAQSGQFGSLDWTRPLLDAEALDDLFPRGEAP